MATVENTHHIQSVDQFNELLERAPESSLIVLNFHAPWAAPCAQMNQVFKSLAKQAQPDSMTLFISVDAELYPEISESYDVTAVPYFVLLKGRVIAKKISGADPKELADSVTKFSGTSAKYNLPPPQTAVAQPQNAVAGADAMTADGTTDTTDINGAPAEPEEEDINTRLAKLVKAAPVMLFMKGTPAVPQCGFSRQVVALLRKREVRYGFFNILADDEVRQGLKEFSDWPTFPQLYVDGDFIGGLDIIKEEFENDPDFLKNYAAAA